jgi:tetratricopeptide (TPR) repeat protein
VGFDPNLATGIVALAIVAGFVIGFLAMYIETRTFLSPMFLRTAKIEQRLSKTDLSTVEDAPRPSSGPQQPALSPDQRAAIGRVAAQPISTAKTPEELATWAKAMFWEEDYADAAQGYTQALVSQPNDYKMRRENGRALVLAGKIDLGIAEIDKAREQAAKAQDLAAMQELDIDRVWAHLYRPVDGFEKAIEFGQKIMTDNPTLAGDPQLQTYMACAYGQKYARYSIQEKADLANQAAEEAKVAIKKVIDAPSGASWRKFLQTLASGRSTDDDDLAILAKERDDVRKMIDDATS